jgi:hypothetical protein
LPKGPRVLSRRLVGLEEGQPAGDRPLGTATDDGEQAASDGIGQIVARTNARVTESSDYQH